MLASAIEVISHELKDAFAIALKPLILPESPIEFHMESATMGLGALGTRLAIPIRWLHHLPRPGILTRYRPVEKSSRHTEWLGW